MLRRMLGTTIAAVLVGCPLRKRMIVGIDKM
jgi:hypothetical protein